jgi:hypothetical protein
VHALLDETPRAGAETAEVNFFQYNGFGLCKMNAANKTKQPMNKHKLALVMAFAAATISHAAAESLKLNPHLTPLAPLLGKTWKGTFKNSKPDHPVIDVAHWERALNGQAVRQVHSINGGAYGGETIFIWDEKKQAVAYYYFTTGGFMTTGTLQIKDGHFVTSEQVSGDADGVTEVRATSEIQTDGKFHVKAEYLKQGQWVTGHEVTYQEDPASQVVFK